MIAIDSSKISSQAFQIKCNGVTGLLPYSAQNYAGMYSLEPLLIADKLPTQWAVRMKFIPLLRKPYLYGKPLVTKLICTYK